MESATLGHMVEGLCLKTAFLMTVSQSRSGHHTADNVHRTVWCLSRISPSPDKAPKVSHGVDDFAWFSVLPNAMVEIMCPLSDCLTVRTKFQHECPRG